MAVFAAWRMVGLENAVSVYGADDAFPIGDIDDILPGLLEGRDRVYYTMGFHKLFDARVISWVNQIRGQSRAGQRHTVRHRCDWRPHPPQRTDYVDVT